MPTLMAAGLKFYSSYLQQLSVPTPPSQEALHPLLLQAPLLQLELRQVAVLLVANIMRCPTGSE